MKNFSFVRAALALLAPAFVLSVVLIGPDKGGPDVAISATHTPTPAPAGPTPAQIQVAFISTINVPPPTGFQNVFLNVTSVRVNPKPRNLADTTFPAEADPLWQTIPIPTGTGPARAGRPGDLQIDLVAAQSVAQLFNTFGIKVDKFHSIEVVLDTTNPGVIVPVCGGAIEGCIQYQMKLQSPQSQLSFHAVVPTAKQTLTQLLINLDFNIISRPQFVGDSYTVSVIPGGATSSAFLATVTGTVNHAQGVMNPIKGRKLTITAEPVGTNNIVATAPVNTNTGNFTLFLPASSDIGTAYDLYASGASVTFDAIRTAPLFVSGVAPPTPVPTAGTATPTATPSPVVFNFNVQTGQTLGNLTGSISDACTGAGIGDATLNLLIAPDGVPSPGKDFCITNPSQCVVVATSSTNPLGVYPLPGTNALPAAFNSIPILPTAGPTPPAPYILEVSAPGYDTALVEAEATMSEKGGKCNGATTIPCNLSLTTAYLTGTVQLVAAVPPGTNVLAQVFAEDTGTNNLENSLPFPVLMRPGNSSAPFTLNVPSAATISTGFDLFTSAIDLYQGNSDPYPGHSIEVLSDVPVPAACTTVTVENLPPMNCTGHGSVTGSVANPDTGTQVELSKDNVQLMTSPVGVVFPGQTPSNQYSFCAPPDPDYSVQRLEQGTPTSTPTAIGLMAMPQATSTGCPTNCSFMAVPSESATATSTDVPTSDETPSPTSTPTPVLQCPGTCFDTTGPPL